MSLNLTEIMPHRTPMLLIEKILVNSLERLVASVRITEQSFGFEKDSVPSWFGVEYMAQAIAAYNGLNFSNGSEPEIGFLVGVRSYKVTVEKFRIGSELEISVQPNFLVGNSGSFECKIMISGVQIAEALITTYKPDQEMIEKLKGEGRE